MCAYPTFVRRREELYTLKEAAEYLHVQPCTLYRWRHERRHEIPCSRIGGRIFYRKRDLDCFINR